MTTVAHSALYSLRSATQHDALYSLRSARSHIAPTSWVGRRTSHVAPVSYHTLVAHAAIWSLNTPGRVAHVAIQSMLTRGIKAHGAIYDLSPLNHGRKAHAARYSLLASSVTMLPDVPYLEYPDET